MPQSPPPPNELFIPINGFTIRFIKAHIQGQGGISYVDTEYKYYYKIPASRRQGVNERNALEMLQKYPMYFPRIVGYYNNFVILEYIKNAERFQKKYSTSAILAQANEILNILKHENIIHNDIYKDNILVDNLQNLYLIDFGRCTFKLSSHSSIDHVNIHKMFN